MQRVRRIALTGGIATGKSHVLATLAAAGIPTIDADTLAREAVAPGSPALAAVVARFGAGLVDATGALDRKALAAIVFADPMARRDLEAIIHPPVREATERWFTGLDPSQHPLAVVAIPLLYEAHRERDFDAVIATLCAPETQLQRLMMRDGLSDAESRARLAAQLPAAEKAARADYVIRTDGTAAETDEQVRALVARFRE
jgi:dephospho-CoA kinase